MTRKKTALILKRGHFQQTARKDFILFLSDVQRFAFPPQGSKLASRTSTRSQEVKCNRGWTEKFKNKPLVEQYLVIGQGLLWSALSNKICVWDRCQFFDLAKEWLDRAEKTGMTVNHYLQVAHDYLRASQQIHLEDYEYSQFLDQAKGWLEKAEHKQIQIEKYRRGRQKRWKELQQRHLSSHQIRGEFKEGKLLGFLIRR